MEYIPSQGPPLIALGKKVSTYKTSKLASSRRFFTARMYSQQNPSPATSTRKSIATRQRVSRACDRCNHLRVKCDGQRPCEHCLIYGLDCRYERERKKRGKGSLTNSSKENCAASSEIFGRQNTNNAPMTPVTAKTSPASSPCTFHLSIPPSHLFNGNVPEVKECLPEEFMPIPSCSRPSQNSESQNQFCKIGPGSTRRAYLSVLTDQNHCDAQSISTQSSCHRAPESTCYASQFWSRGYDAVDQPKIPLSPNTISIPPEDYQLLPYMPICASCQTNPSVRLYPGSIVWLPSPPSPYYAPTECGAVLEGEAGTYCFVDQNNVEKGT